MILRTIRIIRARRAKKKRKKKRRRLIMASTSTFTTTAPKTMRIRIKSKRSLKRTDRGRSRKEKLFHQLPLLSRLRCKY